MVTYIRSDLAFILEQMVRWFAEEGLDHHVSGFREARRFGVGHTDYLLA